MAASITHEKPIVLKTATMVIMVSIIRLFSKTLPNSVRSIAIILRVKNITLIAIIVGLIVGLCQLYIWWQEGKIF